jgi:hypothetical protein
MVVQLHAQYLLTLLVLRKSSDGEATHGNTGQPVANAAAAQEPKKKCSFLRKLKRKKLLLSNEITSHEQYYNI